MYLCNSPLMSGHCFKVPIVVSVLHLSRVSIRYGGASPYVDGASHLNMWHEKCMSSHNIQSVVIHDTECLYWDQVPLNNQDHTSPPFLMENHLYYRPRRSTSESYCSILAPWSSWLQPKNSWRPRKMTSVWLRRLIRWLWQNWTLQR